MICKVQLEYSVFKTPMSDEKYQKLRSVIRELPVVQPTDDFYWHSHSADISKLAQAGFEFTVKTDIGDMSPPVAVSIFDLLEGLQNTLDQKNLTTKIVNLSVTPTEENWISKVDEVINVDDCCTDNLQDHLNQGWRIISVILLKGNRRPDYILGRIKKVEE